MNMLFARHYHEMLDTRELRNLFIGDKYIKTPRLRNWYLRKPLDQHYLMCEVLMREIVS